ncbi:Oidioi.mRNA.OKI2018_I69.YSR.g17043.t1.cds [Oikopleura dioica]|uniref:Oidioi.mRNA.OKI2018_I69.YSR.g17043.t1.cds n=1 Tax=Oikopleura dioica TaxID=34765 RepID=A0ABN7SI14_OIKDI|nr:Oidioi.mRNA.OKI2018_I69.YSR.g17043.t1.cds [Oikopleura dioica]
MFVEPRVKDQFSCICPPCYNLRNICGRVSDLLFHLEITTRKLTLEETLTFLMASKGCKQPLYQDLGVFLSSCASFSCQCSEESSLDFSETLKKYERVKEIMEDKGPYDMMTFKTKIMSKLARKRDHGVLKDIAQTKAYSAKGLIIELTKLARDDLGHLTQTILTAHLCSKLCTGEVHPREVLTAEADFAGEFSAGKTGGTSTQANTLRSGADKDELIVHTLILWGYRMSEKTSWIESASIQP